MTFDLRPANATQITPPNVTIKMPSDGVRARLAPPGVRWPNPNQQQVLGGAAQSQMPVAGQQQQMQSQAGNQQMAANQNQNASLMQPAMQAGNQQQQLLVQNQSNPMINQNPVNNQGPLATQPQMVVAQNQLQVNAGAQQRLPTGQIQQGPGTASLLVAWFQSSTTGNDEILERINELLIWL